MTAPGRRLPATARDCPLHGGRMAYRHAGATWPHLWECNAACWWGAESLTATLVAGRPGMTGGDGYLTWEQYSATAAAASTA